MKKIIIAVLVSFCLFSCQEKNKKPNIVVVLCDDLGFGDLASFGHPIIESPNLDEMGRKGLRLTNFYSAAPVCSPSRVGLMTGRSPNRAGVYDFIPGPKKSEDLRDLVHMQAHEKTIPQLLKTVGYATCLSGKWHCNSKFNSDAQPKPEDFGFDHWFATHNNAAPTHENPRNFIRNGEKVGEIKGFSCQIVVDEALSWLDSKKSDTPFYLQVTFHEPHEPIASPEELVQKYLPVSKNREEAKYYANVENMDNAVGRLMSYLKKNHGKNTLVVFSSDNGPETLNRHPRSYRSYGSPGELKGMKLWTNDAGMHVPGIFYWIGKDTYQGTSKAVVSSLDFMPTFCELSGAELPEVTLDGESFASIFNKGSFEREKPLLWCFYDALNERIIAMRKGDWKIMCKLTINGEKLPRIHNIYEGNKDLIKNAALTDFVMYNLKNDIGETKDLSVSRPEIFNEMKASLEVEYQELLKGSHVWTR